MDNKFSQEWDTAVLQEVIITTNQRRGEGVVNDPVRVVTQVWTTDGMLIAENDPKNEGNE